MHHEDTDVVIVGAGGGGAVLSLALAQRGIRACVLERSPGPSKGLRGEILQPNGQRILERLGIGLNLPPESVRAVQKFHFCQAGGGHLCTIDYGLLPPPYNRAMVTLPNAVHEHILQTLETTSPGSVRYGVTFQDLLWHAHQVTGVLAERGGQPVQITARLVVGADGWQSRVRDALGFRAQVHRYRDAYLVSVLNASGSFPDARYFVGHRTILGMFPAPDEKIYLVYMIPAGSLSTLKEAGLQRLRSCWTAISPADEKTFDNLQTWDQTAYMPTVRVRAARWVADGAALIGDAAHAMNPHASQGRMQAMADALTLTDVIESCLERQDWSAASLYEYERRRRPQVTMLQRLADEEVRFWNTGNPILGALRNRVFRTLDQNRRLQYKILTATAGLRTTAPLNLLDRLYAVGIIPDPRKMLLDQEDPANLTGNTP